MKSGPTPPTSWVISFWAYWPQGEFSCSTLMPVFSSTIGLYWLNCSPHQWVWRSVAFTPAAGLAAAAGVAVAAGAAAGAAGAVVGATVGAGVGAAGAPPQAASTGAAVSAIRPVRTERREAARYQSAVTCSLLVGSASAMAVPQRWQRLSDRRAPNGRATGHATFLLPRARPSGPPERRELRQVRGVGLEQLGDQCPDLPQRAD